MLQTSSQNFMPTAARSEGGEATAELNANHPNQNKTAGTSMDTERQESVEEPISMRKRQRQHKSVSASPATPQKSGGKTKNKRSPRKKHTPEKLYGLKTPGILRQRTVKGKVQYLVNWADDLETGEPYTPTWEPYEYVTEAARAEWQNRPNQGKVEPSSSASSVPDSQPINSAKRRRTISSPRNKAQTLSRKRRKTRGGDLASLESNEGGVDSELPSEIKDSYEEDGQSLLLPAGPRVEVPVSATFDPSEYQIVPSSQPTGSQFPESTQSANNSSSAPAIETPVRRQKLSFIWDEDDPDAVTPGSQDSGSASYRPTQTQFSTGLATTSSGGLSSQPFATQLVNSPSPGSNSSHVQSEISGIVETQSEELDSKQAQATYVESTTQDTSSHSTSVPEALSAQTQSTPPSQAISNHSSEEIESSEPSLSAPRVVVDQLTQPNSSEQPISTQESPFSQIQSHWSEGGAQNQNQSIPAQSSPDLDQSSSPAFLTQVPLQREADIIRQASPNKHREESSSQALFTQEEAPLPENSALVDSYTLRAEFSQPLSSQVPSSSLAHQSLQLAITSSPPRHSSVEQEVELSSEGQAIDNQARSQIALPEADGRRSQAKSEDSYPSSHLPSPPLEEDPSIVEANADVEALVQSVRQSTPIVAPPDEQSQIAQSSVPSTPASSMEQDGRSTPRLSATQIIRQKMAEATAKFEAEYDAKIAARDAERGFASASTASSSVAPSALASPSPAPPAVASPSLPPPTLLSPSPQPPMAASPSPLPPVAGEPQVIQQTAPSSHMLPAIELSERTIKHTFNGPIELDSDMEDEASGLDLVSLQEEEYCIPLPMVSGARSIYVQTVRNNRSQVHSFSNDEYFESSLVKDIDSMMVDLELLCDHQDLIEPDSATQRMDSDEVQAKWAENVSTKCIFLSELLQAMRRTNQRVSVMVLVRPGRMLEILESMMKFHGFVYNRADIPGWKGDTGALRISIVPSSGKDLHFERPSIIIGFDSTHRAIPNLLDLRTNPKTNKVAPLFSLLITNSIEHIERCFDKDIEVMDRKVSLVRCISQINEDVGILRPGYDEPERAAAAAAEFLVNQGPWPLRQMPLIELVDIESRSTDEASRPPSSRKLSNELSSSVQVAQSGLKRSMEPESIGSKRQKLSPSSGDVSHISNSGLNTSSSVPKATAEFMGIMEDADALDDESANQVVALLKKINDLELSLRAEKETSISLLSINSSLEARCKDYESSIANIRPKYQDALNDRGQFEYSYKEMSVVNARLVKDNQAKTLELTNLKDLNTTLTTQLFTAREALKNSTVPGVVEFETQRAELVTANEKVTKLEKRIENQNKDLEYMRANYQNASSAATESASEIGDLKDEVMELRGKADETRIKIQKLITEKEISELIKRNRELKNRCEEVERLNEQKNEELRALMAGRRTTRGTSVPRSPRLGSAVASPSNRRGPLGAVAGGSRGTSPAPAEGGPVRGVFGGEALFQDGKGRWGSHLRDQ